jgi:DNA-binding winged helix-turn-helix (wHTH) protein
MRLQRLKEALVVLVCVLCSAGAVTASAEIDEKQFEVSLRMIGHQVLLQHGDSTSRVLPITKEDDRYRISFESEFEFRPDTFVRTIDSIVNAIGLTDGYLVEVENCETGEVVYSYLVGVTRNSDIVPCGPRAQPKACYNLWFTILNREQDQSAAISPTLTDGPKEPEGFSIGGILPQLLLVAILVGLFVYAFRRMQKPVVDPNQIRIGKYVFDKRKMTLSIDNNSVELSGKEVDLLLLLQTSANTTLEREVILKSVWGDEGDYVGRTLDVFISKLRKKLEADSNIKIANIRGVGYKLVVDSTG